MSGPLEGIRVIELAVWHVGPPIGYILGDLGAEVIKIERPDGGDAFRRTPFWFEAINRNKQSVALDLKQDRGREVLYKLVKDADIFVTNFQESLLSRLGANYDTLASHNPRLIYGSVGAYGHRGPQKENRAFETLIQARTGFASILTGGITKEPRVVEGGLFDQTAGTVMTYGILAAVVARERTGKGQKVEGSLLGSAIHLQHGAVNLSLWDGHDALAFPDGLEHFSDPVGDRTKPESPLFNWYRCSDGRWMMFCEPDSDRFWGQFCQVIGAPELADDSRYTTEKDRAVNPQLITKLDEIFARKTQAQWVQSFDEQGVVFAYSPVMEGADLSNDPQALENEYVVELDHPEEGRLKVAGIPLRFTGTPASISSTAPKLGEHTDQVLSRILGLSNDEVAGLRAQGVVG